MIKNLAIRPDGTYIDCTVGGGGHSEQIAKNLSEEGLLIAIDQDEYALSAAKERLSKVQENVIYVHDNFSHLKQIVQDLRVQQIDGILFDLGVSSPQLDQGDRGFSYRYDAPL